MVPVRRALRLVIDGNAGSETVTLSVDHGTLNVTAGTSGAGVAGSGTASVTITGTTAQINALLNTDGTSIYMTMAALFVAQATNTDLNTTAGSFRRTGPPSLLNRQRAWTYFNATVAFVASISHPG